LSKQILNQRLPWIFTQVQSGNAALHAGS